MERCDLGIETDKGDVAGSSVAVVEGDGAASELVTSCRRASVYVSLRTL